MSVFTNSFRSTPDERARYTPAILELLGDRDPIVVLRSTLETLPRSIEGLSDAEVAQREAPDKWSIRHVLAHLADAEIVGAYRMKMILAHDRPRLEGYDQDQFADRLHYGDCDPRQSLDLFRAVRQANLRMIARTAPDDLRRVSVHAERGEESLDRLIHLYAGHDLLHLRQIERIRAVIGGKVSAAGRR